ncbi:hypothetical protein NE865_06095 [Phthorimaea operculella]|nr:hypothetical protein NE865_06095 [Phthorimaea operculella]
MEAPVSKRTPSRCREWERNRRNKFNDALSRLGEIVKEINRVNSGAKEVENVQFPKVEIVEKAIVCLTTFIQEKAHLKAEILALQIKVDTNEKQKESTKKDVSTQVFIGIRKLSKKGKSKKKVFKQKEVLTANTTANTNVDTSKSVASDTKHKEPTKLPILLPKTNVNNKKGPENTIVVLPAAPYLFPQRPLLLPTMPPAFVLVDQNLQTLNKPSFPIVNRINSDVTKTTMVNILPISAYSRPLSAIKSKKGAKSKIVVNKKVKKLKQVIKPKEQPTLATETPSSKATNIVDEINVKEKESAREDNNSKTKILETKVSDDSQTQQKSIDTSKNTIPSSQNDNIKNISDNIITKTITAITTAENIPKIAKVIDTTKVTALPTSTDIVNIEKPISKPHSAENTDDKSKLGKIVHEKDSKVDKNKENKLPNLLESALCESTVDGGNARLELAEEFLAASPTAAFLMSFPLVSGNRADSPAEETPSNIPIINTKDNNHRRTEIASQNFPYFEKPNPSEVKTKPVEKSIIPNASLNKQTEQLKYFNHNLVNKDTAKTSNTPSNTQNDNPFLNLSMSSLLPTSCNLPDAGFGVDFDCNISKSMPSQSSSYASNSNFFYKSDPFSTAKSTIYSTSSISSGHEFNSFGLYPCAMEKYASKTKTDYSNVEDNLMKIGSSRLTYDIDLGWSHKGFDFVSCTSASNTFNKDNILTTSSGAYSSSYNPFNPEFHVPLVSTSNNKKETSTSKPTSSFPDAITSFYSQPTNLWSEDVPFYTNNNVAKISTSRHQNYLNVDHSQMNLKQSSTKQYESKQIISTGTDNAIKPLHSGTTHQVPEKYKKSPSKMHINWMTSEVRPMQTNYNTSQTDLKQNHKPTYNHIDQTNKKQEPPEHNYFPISMHNFPSQSAQEEVQVWPTVRPAGTTEISIDPPPINLPTLVGDLALGPHDKKKATDIANRGTNQTDIQNCSNFFSVTQLMNRSSDNTIPTRYQGATNAPIENQNQKTVQGKQTISHTTSDHNRKNISNTESHIPQPYVFNDPKAINSYENLNQFSHNRVKVNKPDKNSKAQKNSYSAEALIRGGGSGNQKMQDNNAAKFMIPPQKYTEFNSTQDNSVAQVSHFPPILDYSDNSYTGQQFSGTNLYNTTTNTISNSFYSNFMSGSSNLMPGNYTSGPFSGDFIDYNQTSECSYPNHKYTELKMRNQPTIFQQEKTPTNYKSSRRESAAKHKLECSKKDSNKKCQSKRAKLSNEVEEWSDSSHLLWQNKTTTKRHGNLVPEELSFPNYVGNQMGATTGQYQPDFFNSHIMPSNMQPVGHNVDRSLASFPATSRANFNLSTIFPEITMKVQ